MWGPVHQHKLKAPKLDVTVPILPMRTRTEWLCLAQDQTALTLTGRGQGGPCWSLHPQFSSGKMLSEY